MSAEPAVHAAHIETKPADIHPAEINPTEASPPQEIAMAAHTNAPETAVAVEDVTTSHVEDVTTSHVEPAAVPEAASSAASASETSAPHGVPNDAGATAQDTPTFDTKLANTFKEMLNMDKAIKSAEDLVAFNQGNFEAFLKAGQIWATGVQDLGKHIAASTQAQMDETMATVKALSAVKSLKEAMDLQTSLSKAAMEKAMAETTKLADATTKLAEQAMAPITERVTMATEKFARPIV